MTEENSEKLWKLLQLYRWKVESKHYKLDDDDEKEFQRIKNEILEKMN